MRLRGGQLPLFIVSGFAAATKEMAGRFIATGHFHFF
jgi:hypothetical protein